MSSASSLHLGGQVRDLRLQRCHGLAELRVLGGLLRDPRGLLFYPGVPLGQQLPQPRVRSAKPAITAVWNAGHLGHGRTLPRLRPARKQAGTETDAASEKAQVTGGKARKTYLVTSGEGQGGRAELVILAGS